MITAVDGDHRLRLDAFKQLSKMSGVEDEAKKPTEGGEKFVVNIRIGGQDVASVETDVERSGPEPRTLSGTAEAVTAPDLPRARSHPAGQGTGHTDDGGISFAVFGS